MTARRGDLSPLLRGVAATIGLALLVTTGGVVAAGRPSVGPTATAQAPAWGAIASAHDDATPIASAGHGTAPASPAPTIRLPRGSYATEAGEPLDTPAPTATPAPTPALDPPPGPGRFSIDLYDKGDFVSQATKYYCVPASMQTMMNIIDAGADRSKRIQKRLYGLARKLSTPRLVGDGAEPEGWASGLNELGYGPYVVRAERTRAAAIRLAARALRMTGRPVGLLTWRGAHSWVMSGFRATADPAFTNDFTVTHVYIQDVWYPRVSSIWGPSQPPDTLVRVKLLGADYLPWRRPTVRYPEKDGRFVLVIPATEPRGG